MNERSSDGRVVNQKIDSQTTIAPFIPFIQNNKRDIFEFRVMSHVSESRRMCLMRVFCEYE